MFEDGALYPLLGFSMGEVAQDRIVAIEGMPRDVGIDSLKGFSAAAASSGAVGLFHILGVTPEAQTLGMCFQGKRPAEMMELTPKMIQAVEEKLWTAKDERADLVALGCPHFSFAEFRALAELMTEKKVHPSVALWVFTSRMIYEWVKGSGMLKGLKDSGVMVFTDGCPLQVPHESWSFHTMMTNSAKLANYCYSQTGLDSAYGSLEDCAETAVEGRICRREPLWRKH